jgi:peptidoglycan/LPS O-acetylase OafA/YrhL
MTQTRAGGKLLPLEGLRGLAAVVVMCGHMVRGLVPPGDGPLSWLNTLHERVLNGGASVTLFFVLSGFILTLPFAKDPSLARSAVAVVKRWPRLVFLTVVVCVISWGLIEVEGDLYRRAAAMNGNWWMGSHFNGPLDGQDVSLWGAVKEGVFGVFGPGDVHFDPPLWTMRVELLGSLVTFAVAPVLFRIRRWSVRLLMLAGAMLAVGTTPPVMYVGDFLAGILLAMLYVEGRLPRLANGAAALAVAAGIYLYCFSAGPVAVIHAPLKWLLPTANMAHYAWEVASALLMMALLGNPGLGSVLGQGWGVKLGELSFPVYVLHVPFMLSAGAFVVVHATQLVGLSAAIGLAAVVTMGLAFAVAPVLAWADGVWTRALGRLIRVRSAAR